MSIMKVLIVDDEKHVREAIRMLVDWESYGIVEIMEAPEGAAAVQLIKSNQPDIIFTDMLMPIMNGSELLEWIQEFSPSSKTIVISGHDDFGYVRHTIKYGGMDYILKPIDEEQLNEALRKAVDARKTEVITRSNNQDQRIKLNQIKPIYWDKVFTTLTEDPGIYPSLEEELESEFAIAKETRQVRVAVLSLETMQQKIKDKFASNLDLLTYAIANIANEFLEQARSGYAFRNLSKVSEMVIVAWGKVDTFPALVHSTNEGIYRTLGVRFDFGIGTVRRFPAELPISYQEATAVLRKRNLLRSGDRIHLHSDKNSASMTALGFGKYQEDIRMALLSASHEQIRSAVASWFKEVRELDSITIEQLDLWVHEFAVFRARYVKVELADSLVNERLRAMEPSTFITPVDEEGRLSISLWQEEFTQLMLTCSDLLAERSSKSSNIQEIANYIQAHYQADISLQDIADRYSLSREYISRKFKQEMNENISDFIGRIRIEKAKLLLLNPQLRIAQIAEMIGYQDEKYFSKVFKKLVGVSPNQYRKDQ
jgi:two-component system, response regulator YesN